MATRYPIDLLGPAIEAARRALRELEPEEVPASMRKVARYQDRRLPPPFAERLVDELDGNDWLRDRAMEAWPTMPDPALTPPDDGVATDGDTDGDGADRDAGHAGTGSDASALASALFLARPEGWQDRLSELAADRAGRVEEDRIAKLQRTIERLAHERDVAQSKLRAAGAEIERLRADLAAAPTDIGKRHEDELRAARETIEAHERRIRSLEQELAETRGRLEEAEVRVQDLRERLQRERRRSAERLVAEEAARVWPPSDGLEVARRLDELFARFAPPPGSPNDPVGARVLETGQGPRIELPPGVAPDRPAAIDALLRRSAPWRLIVDGYNVAGALADDSAEPFHSAAMRARVEDLVADLCRRATALVSATVVWDSDLVAEEGETRRGVAGIDVTYAPSADVEVARLAALSPLPAVVVSSDREVQAAAEGAGAAVLWSEALAGGRL